MSTPDHVTVCAFRAGICRRYTVPVDLVANERRRLRHEGAITWVERLVVPPSPPTADT